MSLYIHINDEAGLWNCSGPYPSEDRAITEVHRIIGKRQDGPWKRVGKSLTWVNKKKPDYYIEVADR